MRGYVVYEGDGCLGGVMGKSPFLGAKINLINFI